MEYSIPCDKIAVDIDSDDVTKAYLNWCYETTINKLPVLLFSNKAALEEGTLFLLIHGNPNGTVMLENQERNLEEVLVYLIEHKLVGDTVKRVFTISCHGGAQKEAVVNNIIIASLHNSMTEIFMSLYKGKLIIELTPKKRTIALRLLYGKIAYRLANKILKLENVYNKFKIIFK